MTMDCAQARHHLHDLRRRRLDGPGSAAVVRHLTGCPACGAEDEAEALLDRLLTERLPRRPVPPALQARLAALAAAGPASDEGSEAGPEPEAADGAAELVARGVPAPARLRRRAIAVALPALAAGLIVAGGAALMALRPPDAGAAGPLAAEAVNDHLRLLVSAHPLDVPSTENHEVKPWFAGRLDFAPTVPAGGDGVELLGGAVGYFLDRKAAVVSYGLRRHRLTLIAFPAGGLEWPANHADVGGVPATAVELRGFQVLLWRQGELGYALVSDVAAPDFRAAAARLAPATRVAARP
jgi:anti-sigma factor RsiW